MSASKEEKLKPGDKVVVRGREGTVMHVKNGRVTNRNIRHRRGVRS